MAQRAEQWLSLQTATGAETSSGQSGARQRTAAHFCDQAAARSSAFLRDVTRAQSSAAQQPLAAFTGSGLYVVTAQSPSLAHSTAVEAGGFLSGAGVSAGVEGGAWVGAGWLVWSCDEQAARAITSRRARMAGGWH